MNFPDVREVLTELASDLVACLRFYSRLPIPPFGFELNPHGAEISARVKMLPLAGALIGSLAALVLLLVAELGLTPQIAAIFAIFTLIVVTGAFHEDGLADFADATGGATPEQRLTIMKDSRIGTFGDARVARQRLAADFQRFDS